MYNPFAAAYAAGMYGVPAPAPAVPAMPPQPHVPIPLPPAPTPAPAPAQDKPRVSIAQAAMQSAMAKREGRVVMKANALKRTSFSSPAAPEPQAVAVEPIATETPQQPPEEAVTSTESKRRRRWDSAEPVSNSTPSSSLECSTVPAPAPSEPAGKSADAKKSAYEEQLKAQKEIQFLEARIRSMQGQNSKLQSLEQLHDERLKHYKEYGSSSDEEADKSSETWEHKRRAREMLKTAEKALEVTKANVGKHFIGDFLPKDELERLKKEAEAIRRGEAPPAVEDFAANKLDATNKGYNLLQKAGWSEGSGLGATGEGRAAPVNLGATTSGTGVGVAPTHKLEEGDDDFDEYRKRMMLAYRFRPNPMNNPRRSYY